MLMVNLAVDDAPEIPRYFKRGVAWLLYKVQLVCDGGPRLDKLLSKNFCSVQCAEGVALFTIAETPSLTKRCPSSPP